MPTILGSGDSINVGDDVTKDYFVNLAYTLNAVMGLGSGQSGYGQRVTSYEDYTTTSLSSIEIGHTEWLDLKNDINRASNHQQGYDAVAGTPETGKIIGADASGTGVTRNTDGTFTITGANSNAGVNDWHSAVISVVANADLVDSGEVTYPDPDPDATAASIRQTPWGTGTFASINCTFDVQFDGGYTCTNDSGVSVTATGEDHRRHFFNAGGELVITGQVPGPLAIDSDWNQAVGGKVIKIGKNKTTVTGGGSAANGVDPINGSTAAVGNYQLTTSPKFVYYKQGGDSDADYADNYWTVEAWRQGTDTVRIRVTLHDDKTVNPLVDEQVGTSTGFTEIKLQLSRPTGGVEVPAPTLIVVEELE